VLPVGAEHHLLRQEAKQRTELLDAALHVTQEQLPAACRKEEQTEGAAVSFYKPLQAVLHITQEELPAACKANDSTAERLSRAGSAQLVKAAVRV
jgi:hypothetical protein